MITVHITDDHKMLIEGISALINESNIATITGVSYTLEVCRKMLAFQRPDVLLLDLQLPDGSGLDFCAEIKQKYPHLKVLALTSYCEYSTVHQMMDNGADGYILKNAIFDEMLEGIEAVMRGEQFLCKDVQSMLRKVPNPSAYLTTTERSILRLIAEGYKNKEIADQLSLSVETIKSYRKDLILKFDMRIAAIVTMAIRKNWI
ncbi:MAG: response regulator transcription factor [Tannerella sp.]|jgi:DNA-binding NarL/FixJ family response regulator|nr:response regulator transcription factor [Tannerella sp.]